MCRELAFGRYFYCVERQQDRSDNMSFSMVFQQSGVRISFSPGKKRPAAVTALSADRYTECEVVVDSVMALAFVLIINCVLLNDVARMR